MHLLCGMCYDLTFVEIKRLEWELKQSRDPEARKKMMEHLKRIKEGTIFWTKGFSHLGIPVIYMEAGQAWLDSMQWGLIPRWSRDAKKAHELWNKTLNARGEEMFEKPSYRASALDRRCIIMATGFFEYHHQGKETYPFLIQPKDGGALYIGALWDEARIDGEVYRTVSMVTVAANEVMAQIHNGPANHGRMPLIIPEEFHEQWLKPIDKSDALAIEKLKRDVLLPFDSSELIYFPVARPAGKTGVGNKAQMHERHEYAELALKID